jgi:uncharacterized protein with LGFP repeats
MTVRNIAGPRRDRLRIAVAALAIAVGLSGSVTAVARADEMVGRYLVKGQIEVAFFATGGVASWGAPTGPESAAANGGRVQNFGNHTAFYYHPLTGAHEIGGAILDKFRQLGAERGVLGYPTTDEIQAKTLFGPISGAMNNFQNGVIYWSPGSGAWPVRGGILTKWDAAKRESGKYGYPVGAETKTATGWSQNFQHGAISFP